MTMGITEAEELMNSILAKEPDRKDVKNNLGYLYLTLGKFKEGWEKYEYRWKVDPGDKVVWSLKDNLCGMVNAQVKFCYGENKG